MPHPCKRWAAVARATWTAVGVAVGALSGLAALPHAAGAQVGDVSTVRWPGWVPADRVDPALADTVEYDPAGELWRYRYTIGNGAGAAQGILAIDMRFSGATTALAAPAGWQSLVFRPPAAQPGASWLAQQPDEYGDSYSGQPAAAQIAPGGSRDGFRVESAAAPGYARVYVQGYARLPYPPDSIEIEDTNTPHDTLNAQRRWTLGPTRYTTVVTGGNRRPGVDGFLGFMNLATSGSVTIDPTPIAIKFALGGETVLRETFRATLNGVDVTAAFKPASAASGADLVAVFRVGSSALTVGKNVLLTHVDGLKAGTTQRATDADRVVFRVDGTTNGGTVTGNALNNLPFPDPGETIDP